ncbi:MAG: hypothetical protein RLZZ273_1172 [Bacteroidota bacterium]
MLKKLDVWVWRYALAVVAGGGASFAAIALEIDPLLQLGRVILITGSGAMYACYQASKFFGTQSAKMVQGVFLACFVFLLLISAGRLFGGSISQDLAVVQLIGFMGFGYLFPAAILGFAGLMASNYMRVPSGRIRGIREIAAALAASLMAFGGFFHWLPEVHALVCALVVMILVLTA